MRDRSGGLKIARTRLVQCDLIRHHWVGNLSMTVEAIHIGVVGEHNPEAGSERVYDQVTDTGEEPGLRDQKCAFLRCSGAYLCLVAGSDKLPRPTRSRCGVVINALMNLCTYN